MTATLATYLWIVGLIVLVWMVRQYMHGEHDLLSLRNIYLVGFVLFQLSSTAVSLLTEEYSSFYVREPVLTGMKFVSMATLYLVLMLWSYRRGWYVLRLADRVPRTDIAPGPLTLLCLAVLLTGLSSVLRFGVQIPLVAIVASDVGTGAGAVACGLVGWVWARRFFNPLLLLLTVAIVIVNAMNIMAESFGRRGLVTIFLTLLWGMYYSAWRYEPWKRVFRRLALVCVPGVIGLALFTSVRSFEGDKSAGAQIDAIRQSGSVVLGMLDLLRGQDTGPAALWTIENFPNHYHYRHLFTIRYFLVYPVPRAWWPGKPEPLSLLLPELANIPDVPWGVLTIPPGIVGNAEAEGGWYALVIYGLLTGLFLRFFDRVLLNSVTSPFVVLPMAAAVGQILALARGEPSAFAFIFVETGVIIWLFMLLFAKLLDASGLVNRPSEQAWLPQELVEAEATQQEQPARQA